MLIVVVPDARRARTIPGMKQLLHRARVRQIPLFVCDGASDVAEVAAAVIAGAPTDDSCRVYVTGPRSTRWPEGDALGRHLVCALAIAVPTPGPASLVVY